MRKLVGGACFVLALCMVAQLGEAQDRWRPVVHADRTVTFRMDAPGADTVAIHTKFTDGLQAMEKGGNSRGRTAVLRATTGSARSDSY
jgi:hypothetical protein